MTWYQIKLHQKKGYIEEEQDRETSYPKNRRKRKEWQTEERSALAWPGHIYINPPQLTTMKMHANLCPEKENNSKRKWRKKMSNNCFFFISSPLLFNLLPLAPRLSSLRFRLHGMRLEVDSLASSLLAVSLVDACGGWWRGLFLWFILLVEFHCFWGVYFRDRKERNVSYAWYSFFAGYISIYQYIPFDFDSSVSVLSSQSVRVKQ